MSDHPGYFTLERHAVGDLPEPHRLDVERHLAACDACRARHREIAAPAVTVVAVDFVRDLSNRRRFEERARWKWIGAGATLAMAAALVLVMLRPPPHPATDISLRGGSVTLHRMRGTEQKVLSPSDGVRALDRLRVVVTLTQPSPIAVWFVDPTGSVYRSFLQEAALGPGTHVLPDTAQVESPCTGGWLVVATGTRASAATEIELQARARTGFGQAAIDTDLLVIPLRCE